MHAHKLLSYINYGLLGVALITDGCYGVQHMLQLNSQHDEQLTKHNQHILDKHATVYNQRIQQNDRSMADILQQSYHTITATIFVGTLPNNTNNPKQILRQLDSSQTPHNWMFPNIITNHGIIRLDTSSNADKNFGMYLDLNIPAFTSEKELTDDTVAKPVCDFAYEIVLWSKQQPIAVYQCTTDADKDTMLHDTIVESPMEIFMDDEPEHTKLNYPAAFTVLNNHVNPTTGQLFQYQAGQAVFLRNRGDQPQVQHVDVIKDPCTQLPHLKFKLSNEYNEMKITY